MNPNIRTGTVEGTGAAINISLGFIPDYVKVINVEDGDIMFEWFAGMTNGHAIQSINVVDSGTSGAAGLSRITSNGISAYNGSTTAGAGFTLGTAISENGKDLAYLAVRNGAGA